MSLQSRKDEEERKAALLRDEREKARDAERPFRDQIVKYMDICKPWMETVLDIKSHHSRGTIGFYEEQEKGPNGFPRDAVISERKGWNDRVTKWDYWTDIKKEPNGTFHTTVYVVWGITNVTDLHIPTQYSEIFLLDKPGYHSVSKVYGALGIEIYNDGRARVVSIQEVSKIINFEWRNLNTSQGQKDLESDIEIAIYGKK